MNYTKIDHLASPRSMGGKSVLLVLMMLVATISGAAVVNNTLTLRNEASESTMTAEQCSTQGFQVQDGSACPTNTQLVGTVGAATVGVEQKPEGSGDGDSQITGLGGASSQTPRVCCRPELIVPTKIVEVTEVPATPIPSPTVSEASPPPVKACVIPEVVMTVECPEGCIPAAIE